MKPISEYAFEQLRYRKLMQLNYKQAPLVTPSRKVFYRLDPSIFASRRLYEWYSTPQAVLASPKATPAMRQKALMVRNSRNGFTRPPKKRDRLVAEDWI